MVDYLLKREKDITDIPDTDLRWCTVSLREVIEKSNRIEATVFDVEGKNAREILKKCKWELKNLCGGNGFATSYRPPICKRIFVEKENGIPTYTPSQILEINPKPQKYLSHKTRTDLSSWVLKEDEIVLTCSGTIGNVSLVTDTLKGKCFSQNLIRIQAKKHYEAGYIYSFLKTDIGNKLVSTNNYGAVIKHIDPSHLDNIPIPDPPIAIKKEISNLIMSSFQLRDDSNTLLNRAEELLINELQLPPIENLEPDYFNKKIELKNYSLPLSKLSLRLEASYHDPVINNIIKQSHVKEYKCVGDKDISKQIILPGRFKRVYVEEGQGVLFFGGKQIHHLDPSNKKYLSTKHHKERINSELRLKENMILITCSGTIGKTNITPKHWDGWTANQHILRIVPSSIHIAGYLFVFLDSEYGYKLINRFSYGATVDEITDKHVSQVLIPILKDQTIQSEINNLALLANQKRYEAYKLEQQAIKLVREKVIHTGKL